mgnify:CR=1 FL=1
MVLFSFSGLRHKEGWVPVDPMEPLKMGLVSGQIPLTDEMQIQQKKLRKAAGEEESPAEEPQLSGPPAAPRRPDRDAGGLHA